MLLAAACGGGNEKKDETWLGTPPPDSSTSPTDTSATADATHPGSPGGTALVPEVEAGTTVLVMLNDNSIAVREQSIPPGPAVLTIENRGNEVHNLVVEGEGINSTAGDTIPQGQSRTLDLQFKPGTYTFYCPIAGHREKGEQVQVTIAR